MGLQAGTVGKVIHEREELQKLFLVFSIVEYPLTAETQHLLLLVPRRLVDILEILDAQLLRFTSNKFFVEA